jgi:hypothetical protein
VVVDEHDLEPFGHADFFATEIDKTEEVPVG